MIPPEAWKTVGVTNKCGVHPIGPNMKYNYQSLNLSDNERLWLSEIFRGNTSRRKIRAKLYGQIDPKFDPESIDKSLLWGDGLSLIGIWYTDSKSPLFGHVDKLIKTIKDKIIKNPDLESITSEELSKLTAIPQEYVELALYYISQLGHFYSSASGKSGGLGFAKFDFLGEKAFDDYLRYQSLDWLLEECFNSRHGIPTRMPSNSRDSEHPVCETKKGTAFIIMPIDPNRPELEDINTAIKEVCSGFKIKAYRADEIEHQERITDVVLNEIESSEFLIADLTLEKPNVYYEVGYAHAIGKKPILFRKQGTKLHFDLSVHNVPEYRNATTLRKLLTSRLEAMLGQETGWGN